MKQDRIVVITGAAGGMGSVFVARFLANGDTVIATDNRGEELNELPSHMKLSLVVGTVFFLAPPEADFLTGQIINVDGGSHMH